MNSRQFRTTISLLAALAVIGCGSDVGVKVDKVAGGQAYVQGTPQERIAKIQSDPSMPEAEKQRRISTIKQRFHLP